MDCSLECTCWVFCLDSVVYSLCRLCVWVDWRPNFYFRIDFSLVFDSFLPLRLVLWPLASRAPLVCWSFWLMLSTGRLPDCLRAVKLCYVFESLRMSCLISCIFLSLFCCEKFEVLSPMSESSLYMSNTSHGVSVVSSPIFVGVMV